MKLIRNSLGAGAVLAAAQVGVGSGLGVLDWPLSISAMRGWGQLLTWVAFIFAVSVAGGAVIGRRALRRPRPTLTIRGRIAAAGAAGLGAAAAFPLVWIPVRVSQSSADLGAEVTMAVTAGIGIGLGMLLAVIALTRKSVAASIAASATWVWLFALASVGLAAKDHVRVSPRLGMIDAPQMIVPDGWWLGPYLMVGIAALLGLAVAAVAGWNGAGWLGITLSGLAGPALVASAYLTTGWGMSGNGEDAGPYVASLLAVGSGLLASMAVASATIPHRPAPRPGAVAPTAPVQPALESLPAPLAITAYAEPAYVLESSSVEPPYRRQPGFYTEPIYLAQPRVGNAHTPPAPSLPAAGSDLNRRPEPAAEASYEPPYEAPYEPPYDPQRQPQPAMALSSTTAAAQASSEPSDEVAPSYEPGHAVAVEAVVVEPEPVATPTVPVVEDAVVVGETVGDTVLAEVVGAPAGGSAPGTGGRKGRDKAKDKAKDSDRRPSGRRLQRPDNEGKTRALRQVERDHIDWIDNLVKLPADPTLKMTKER